MNKLKFEERAKGKEPTGSCRMSIVGKFLCTLLCSSAFVVMASAQTTIEGFEYGSDAALLSAWTPQSATLTTSANHSSKSTGTTSMRVDRTFPAGTTETEILTGPMLPAPIALAATQYLSLRIAGSAPSTNASWQKVYLYAFDGSGNFGRWSATVSKSTTWQVASFRGSAVETPSESPAPPDLSNIVQFKFYLTGQGATGGVATATMYLDDLGFLAAPMLSIVQTPTPHVLMENLIPGISYTLQQTTNLTRPVTVTYTFPANNTSQTWPIPKGQQAFYKLYFAP